jgi:hypothetical protein
MALPNVETLCGAATNDGTPCENPAMRNGRCHIHGGETPGGIASPHFKHGRYSKYLPTRILERFQESLEDPDVTSLETELRLLDVRIGEVFEGLDHGESGELWSALTNAGRAVRQIERDAKDVKEPAALELLRRDRETAIEMLLTLAEQGLADWATWNSVFSLWERRRKLALAQVRRDQVAEQMVPIAEVVAMKYAIAEIIRTHVPDPDQRSAIVAALEQLDTGPSSGA